MLRYFVLAAAIVFGVAVVVAGWTYRDMLQVKLKSVYLKVPAKGGPANPRPSGSVAPFHGEASWALSALPECLIQTSKTTGSRDFVLGHLPAGSVPVAPQESLVYGDCTISVGDGEAHVVRGPDRFYIPPPVRFYRTPGSLSLMRGDSNGMELRVYQPVPQ